MLDVNRVWFMARAGVQEQEVPRDMCLCNYVILEEAPSLFVIPDLTLHEMFKAFPHVTGPPYLRFCAAVPLISGGCKIGTFCIADKEPRYDFDEAKQACLIEFAELVSELVEAHRVSVEAAKYDLPKLNATLLSQLCSPLSAVNEQYNALSQQRQVIDDNLQKSLVLFESAVERLQCALETSLKLGAALTTQSNSGRPLSYIGTVTISLEGCMLKLQELTAALCYRSSSLQWSLDTNTAAETAESNAEPMILMQKDQLDVLATLVSFISLISSSHHTAESDQQAQTQTVHLSCRAVTEDSGEFTLTMTGKQISSQREEYDLVFIKEVLRSMQGLLVCEEDADDYSTAIKRFKMVVPCHLIVKED